MSTTQNQACYRLKNQFRTQKSDLNRTRTIFQIWHDLAPIKDTTPVRTRKLEGALAIIFSSFVSTNNSIQICGVRNDKRFENVATMQLNIIQFHDFLSVQTVMLPNPTKNGQGLHKLKRSSFTIHCYWVQGTSTVVVDIGDIKYRWSDLQPSYSILREPPITSMVDNMTKWRTKTTTTQNGL